jgi:hypothetical protein
MFVCLFDDDTVAMVDDVYCDIGDRKNAFFIDVNGNKINFRGIVIDVLNFLDEWE